MSENSIDDRYKIPTDLILKTRIDDNFSWSHISGRPIISTLNNIVFHQQTGDSVSSKNHFNLSDAHFELRCTLSEINNSPEPFYIGGWNYYGTINCGDNTITVYGPNNQSEGPFNFNQGDSYTQYYDSTVVKFKINHCVMATFPIEVLITEQNPTLECMYFGFDSADPESSNTVTINNINCYVSGQKGIKGYDGNVLISGVGIPDPELGESGDFYYNFSANSIYGRKYGLGGALFFDGVHANNTCLTIPNDEDLRFGLEDFTIEWFQYMTDDSSGHVLSMINSELTSGMSILFEQPESPGDGQRLIFNANGNLYNFQFLQYEQRWIHIAFTRSIFLDGRQYLNLHVDGVFQTTVQINNESIYNTTDPLTIGNTPNTTGDFKGYITNLRIIKGKAIYVSVFDIPIQPLPDVSGSTLSILSPTQSEYKTVLLLTADTLNNGFVDSSSKHKVITNNNVMWDSITPFKNVGVWNTTPIIVANVPFPISLDSNLSTLWDFSFNGYNSVIIYLNCARSGSTPSYQPQTLSIISVNYNNVNGVKYNVVNGLATGVSIQVTNSAIYARSTTTYNSTKVLVMPIV
jgi:hypothetical protein